jgi:hypothetical protein
MSIQKKSLISTLKTAKKANVASTSHEGDAKGAKVASMRYVSPKATISGKTVASNRNVALRSLTMRSTRVSTKKALD